MAVTVAHIPEKIRRQTSWTATLRGYLFILPVVLGLIIWTFGPMVASAYYSFTDYKIIFPAGFVGAKNYINLFTRDKQFINSLSVTIRYAIMFVALGQVTCLALAVLLTQKVRGMDFFRTFFYLPIIVPYVASSVLWKYLYNKEFGPIDGFLELLGLPAVNWLGSQDTVLLALVLMSVWSSATTTIIYVAGLQHIPEELLDAAKIDGFFNVVTAVIGAFQFFTPAFIMTEGGPAKATYFYNYNLYEKAFKWLEMGYASAMAWVLFAIILFLTFLIFRSSPLWVYYDGEVR